MKLSHKKHLKNIGMRTPDTLGLRTNNLRPGTRVNPKDFVPKVIISKAKKASQKKT